MSETELANQLQLLFCLMALSSQFSQLISDSKGCFNSLETEACPLLLTRSVTSPRAQFPSVPGNHSDISPVGDTEVSVEVFSAQLVLTCSGALNSICFSWQAAICSLPQTHSCVAVIGGWPRRKQGREMRGLADACNTSSLSQISAWRTARAVKEYREAWGESGEGN